MTAKLPIVGATGKGNKSTNTGGQLTLVNKLLDILSEKSFSHKSIDTYIENFPRPSFLSRIFLSFKFQLNLIKEIVSYRPSAVMVFGDIGMSLYEKSVMFFICRIFRVNCLFMICGGYNKILNCSYLYKNIVSFLLKTPNQVVVQGNALASLLFNSLNMKNNVNVIHNWFFQPQVERNVSISNNVVTILFCGWLIETKGVKEIFSVAERFNREYPFVRFVFAGNGTLFKWCENESKKLDNVTLLGWVDSKNKFSVFTNSDIFILPSYAEGFPLVLNEAMSQRLPIVATNVGAIPDSLINGYNGYCIEPKNTDQLYDALAKLVENPELRKVFGENSLKVLKKNHDPDVCFLKLMALLNKKGKDICAE